MKAVAELDNENNLTLDVSAKWLALGKTSMALESEGSL